jgi:hypothetical protein
MRTSIDTIEKTQFDSEPAKIRYNDNDKEELNHTEVRKYTKKNIGKGRMTGEIGQRM